MENKYMLLAYNKQVFVEDGFGPDMFDKKTMIEWQRINAHFP
jgi:hypothetical protein